MRNDNQKGIFRNHSGNSFFLGGDATFFFERDTYLLRGGEPVEMQQATEFFDEIYEKTYKRTAVYVTAHSGDPGDISDILQETYAELYRVLSVKGGSYIRQPEAFVMQLAKTKVYRHYTVLEKAKKIISPSPKKESPEDGDQMNQWEDPHTVVLDDLVADRMLLEQISRFVKTKPIDVQKIFYLYFGLEQTSMQIADALHLKESTVKSKIHRTVHEIRTLYRKVGD